VDNLTIIYILTFLSSILSILSIVVLGFKNKLSVYNSFLFLFFLTDFIYQVVMSSTAFLGFHNHLIANLYSVIIHSIALLLIRSICIKNNGYIVVVKRFIYYLIGLLVIAWIIQNFIVSKIFTFNTVFDGVASFIIAVMAILMLNQLLYIKNTAFFKDPDILIIVGIILCYLSSSVITLFFNFDFKYSFNFYITVLLINNIFYVISNILYFTAVLCLPKKANYTLPY